MEIFCSPTCQVLRFRQYDRKGNTSGPNGRPPVMAAAGPVPVPVLQIAWRFAKLTLPLKQKSKEWKKSIS
jgi:hypothetical protein